MTPRDQAIALAIMTVIADVAKEQKDGLRDDLLNGLDELGVDSVSAYLPGEMKVAKCAIVTKSRKPFVADERAFIEWVSANHADEIVQTIRDSFKKYLMDSVVEGPDAAAVHPATGEIVPGLMFTASAPYVSTRFEKGGREAVIDALRSGVVSISLPGTGLGELEA